MASGQKKLILVIEDEASQCEILAYNLEKAGYLVVKAMDGDVGLQEALAHLPDIVLLDWMLPSISGIEICRQLKQLKETRHIPVIMLTARGDEPDKLRGFDMGADDYVVKPYSVRELLARIRVLLRKNDMAAEHGLLSYMGLEVDFERHRVCYRGRNIKLGPSEFRLLAYFLEKPGRVLSREQIIDKIWDRGADIYPRTVDVHIGRLRKALRKYADIDPIRTIRDFGYTLDLEDEAAYNEY